MASLPRFIPLTFLAAYAMSATVAHAGATRPAAPPQWPATLDVAALRAQGPSALPPLLESYDLLPAGPARDALGLAIDAVAAQRYATVSRLYWYTDLDAAEAAARAQHRPILALRMLGRLDEDLSCANSRFFRTTLYSNAEVSQYLRDHVILYWSSERPVPRVTIDFGDGKQIVTTTTGNSAHYVLAADGTVIDVLPGLYAPSVFRDELAKAVGEANKVRMLPATARGMALQRYHAGSRKPAAGAPNLAVGRLGARLLSAQTTTVSKGIVELPTLVEIGMVDDVAPRAFPEDAADEARTRWTIPPATMLDSRSAALVTTVFAAPSPGIVPPAPAAITVMLARLEDSVLADTIHNEDVLRPQIRAHLASGVAYDFASVNAFVYADIFATPRADEWLGLLPRTDFTGLPADGASRSGSR